MSEETDKLDLSLCLINRNDAQNLDFILGQMSPIVKEIVVVDTGSTDDSVAVAKKYTDKVYATGNKYLDLNGRLMSFAAPREESFSYATQPWVMWLDTDDQIDDIYWFRKDFEGLKAAGERNYLSMQYLYGWNEDRTVCIQGENFFRERIVKNKIGWYWRTPVHEFLDHKDGRDSFTELVAKSKVIHRSNGARNFNDRNFTILKNWLRFETDPELIDRCRYYLADEMLCHPEKKYRYDEFVPIFKEIALKTIHSNGLSNSAAFKASLEMIQKNNFKECIDFLEKYLSLKKEQDCYQYREMLGFSYHNLGNYEKSLSNFEQSLVLPCNREWQLQIFRKEWIISTISWLKEELRRLNVKKTNI